MNTRNIVLLLVAVAIVAYVAASMGARSGSQAVEAGDGYDYSAPAATDPSGGVAPRPPLTQQGQQQDWFTNWREEQDERRRRKEQELWQERVERELAAACRARGGTYVFDRCSR